MIQDEIARLTGTLKFNVDARPLAAFEKRLANVTTMLQQFGVVANKKFNIKVSLDSKTLRAQMEKAANVKVVFRNFSVSEEALAAVSKKISSRLDSAPLRLTNIKVDVAQLVAQKRFVRTLLGQMQVNLPVTVNMKAAEKQLRAWKTATESKYKLRVDADISQARFIANVRKSLRAAQGKIGGLTVKINDPRLRMSVDQADLRAQIRHAISQHEFDVRVRVRRNAGDAPAAHSARSSAIGGGLMGAGMGFMRGAIPGLGAAFAVNHLNKINQQVQAQGMAMTAVMGSQGAGEEQTKWVKDLSNRIGLDFREIAPSYNKMLASGQTSGMSTESVQNIFQGVSEYGRVMGLDSESMKGGMRAVEQMMNKNQVMSEELKGQLAERMPGAISAMAEAAGFGTDAEAVSKLFKAMENGEVKSVAVLENFGNILARRARVGGALALAMESTAAQQARMNNAFTETVTVFAKAGFDKGMAEFFKNLAKSMESAEPGVKALGEAFNLLIAPVNAFIGVGAHILNLLPEIGKLFGLSAGAVTALAIAAGALMLPFGGVALAVAAVALAIEDLIVFSQGGESMFGAWLEESPAANEAFQALSKEASEFGEHLSAALGKVKELAPSLEKLSFSSVFTAYLDYLTWLLKTLNSTLDRLSAGSKYADAMTQPGENGKRSMVEHQYNMLKGAAMGPEAVNAELQQQELANKAANAPKPSLQDLATEDIAFLLKDIKDGGSSSVPPISVHMPVTIEAGGTATPETIAAWRSSAQEMFGDVISEALSGLKEVK